MKLVSAWIAAAVAVVLSIAAPAATALVPATLDPIAPGLPGYGRAWELVTPGEVVSARPFQGFTGVENPIVGLSRSGDRLVYRSAGVLPDAPFGGIAVTDLAVRGTGGWANSSLVAPRPADADIAGRDGPVAFDPGLTHSIWSNQVQPGNALAFYASKLDGSFTQLAGPGAQSFVGASEDARKLVFQSEEHLLPADAGRTSGGSIYERDDSGLRLLDAREDGSLVSNCGAVKLPHGVSTDASRLIFAASPCAGNLRIYLAENGHITEVSAPQCTTPSCGEEGGVVSYRGATPTVSAIFLTAEEPLTDDDTNSYFDLYRYDTASGKLTLLTPRPPGSTASPEGAIAVSSSTDGSRVYFESPGQILPGQGLAEGTNLYLSDAQGLRFVAALAGPFLASNDGRYVLFGSRERLNPSDTDENVDIYRYDSFAGNFTQISTGPEGRGNGNFDCGFPPPSVSVVEVASVLAFDVSAGALFETAEQLLPEDRNDQVDVYEWTPGGGLSLVSGGTPGAPSKLVGVTPDLSSLFFLTTATLLPRDRDGGELDIYVDRAGGGFAEPGDEVECAGACGETIGGGVSRRQLTAGGGGPRLGLVPLDGAARRQIVSRGWTTLLAEAPAAGRLTAVGRARIGTRRLVAANGSAVAKVAGPVHLHLRLTLPARRQLARGRELRVRLVLSFAGAKGRRSESFVLRGES